MKKVSRYERKSTVLLDNRSTTAQEDNRRPNPIALGKIFERMLEFEEEVRTGKRVTEIKDGR